MNLPHYWIIPSIKSEMTADKILYAVCDHYNINIQDLKGRTRLRKYVDARKIAVNLMFEHLDLTLYAIGKAIGYKDHSTVIYNNQKHKDYLECDYEYRSNYQAIKNRLAL